MDAMKLMVVISAGWINQQQEDVIECSTAGTGLADCFATTTGKPRETDDSSFWTLRHAPLGHGLRQGIEHALTLMPGLDDDIFTMEKKHLIEDLEELKSLLPRAIEYGGKVQLSRG